MKVKPGQIWQGVGGDHETWCHSLWVVKHISGRSITLTLLKKHRTYLVGREQSWSINYFDDQTLKFISERDCIKCRDLPQRFRTDGELNKDFMCWSCYE